MMPAQDPKPAAPSTDAAAKKAAAPRKTAAAKKAVPEPAASRPAKASRKAAPPAAGAKPPKLKQKLIRDSFTMPSADFSLIDQLKERALGFKRPAKKSELLRAGLQALSKLSDARLKAMLEGLTPLKAGRPRKDLE